MHPRSLKKFFFQIQKTITFEGNFKGISIDSRTIQKGDLFFAMDGEKTDGHKFLDQVEAKGATAAVVDQRKYKKDSKLALIPVEDVLKCMQDLSKAEIARRKKPIIALTGSYGKTTTKEFLKTILEERFKVAASYGNFNSQIGLCLNVLRQNEDLDLWLLEMGMTEKGHIRRLVNIATPDLAIITNIDMAHAKFFDNVQEIAQAKSEILSHEKTKIGIINKEAKYSEIAQNTGKSQKTLFSLEDPSADFYLKKNNKNFSIFEKGQLAFEGEINVQGAYNQQNFLAACAAARSFGMQWEEICQAKDKLRLPEKRFECYQMGQVSVIDDCYNASPAAFEKILEELPVNRPGKKIGVFGQMLELGKFSEQAHRSLGKKALEHIDLLFCFGKDCRYVVEEWKNAGKTAYLFDEHVILADRLNASLSPGDLVLFKGSRGCQLEKVIALMKT